MIKYVKPSESMIKTVSSIFKELMTDPEGREKFRKFLKGAKNKLGAIEYSLGQLAGKRIIDEEDFAPVLSDVRRLIEECHAGGWTGFNKQGTGMFGSVICLEVTLRRMSHSLGEHMIWDPPEKATVGTVGV